MANRFAIEVGVSANTSGFKAGMDSVRRELSKFGTDLIGKYLGVDALKSLAHGIKDTFVDMINSVRDIKVGSLKTGLDKETFQTTRSALEASGSSADAFATALLHVADAMVKSKEATKEGEKLLQEFASLGVSFDDLQTKTRQQIFSQIAAGLREAAREGKLTEEQLSALKAVLGKAAIEFVPFIARGTDNAMDSLLNKTDEELKKLEEIRQVSKELGAIWKLAKEEAVLTAVGMNDSWISKLLDFFPGIGSTRVGLRALRQHVFGDPAENKAQAAQFDAMMTDYNRKQAREAEHKAGLRIFDNNLQRQREEISQAEFDRDAALEKLKTKEERILDIRKRQAEIRDRMNNLPPAEPEGGFLGTNKERRARMEGTIAELESEARALEAKRDAGSGGRLQVNELQRMGAGVAVRLDPLADPMRRTAASTARMEMHLAKIAARNQEREVGVFD